MRWEQLFDDLEGRMAQEERRELELEVADRTRRERALLGLHERLLALAGSPMRVELSLRAIGVHRGRVLAVGADWVLLDGVGVQRTLAPFAAIVRAAATGNRFETGGGLPKRFTLGYALRELSRDRAIVTVCDITGGAVTGTLDSVGRDMVEVAEHPADVPRRPAQVLARQLVPFAAIAAVRSH